MLDLGKMDCYAQTHYLLHLDFARTLLLLKMIMRSPCDLEYSEGNARGFQRI